MSCGPKRIQLLSVSDHGSHCTLLQKRDDDWWQIPSWFPEFHGFARSLIIRGLHEYSMRSCFERPLYHQMYHPPCIIKCIITSPAPPPPILIMLRIILLKHKLGEISKLEIFGFLTKPFCLHPGKMFFFASIQKRERSLLVCSGNWKLVDRHKGAKELIWEEPIYGRNYTRFLFLPFYFHFVLIYGCPSPIYAMEYFLFVSYFVKAKQEISKNYILQ